MKHYILERKAISEKLKNVYQYPLTVAVAAMGYGKSIAAREFLDGINAKYLWLSIDSDEASAQYIWDSFSSQLTKVNHDLGKQFRALGFPQDRAQEDKILQIIEEQTYRTNTILVIDDYHFNHSKEVDHMIQKIVRANIEGFHILILSRTVPAIGMDELELKGYCHHIRCQLFEMSVEEIIEFFSLYGHSISSEIASEVYRISEGWVSAVYLIMKRYVKIGRIESGSGIERLIETAVMARYTELEKTVLENLSVLESFTSEQASYVTNYCAAKNIVQKISYENSFIRYDEKSDIYRIHNIFNNYLRKRLAEITSEKNTFDLYKRAGEWCILNDDIIMGLNYLLKAKEYDRILEEFEKPTFTAVIDRNPQYIINIFGQIPAKIKYRYPIGYLAYIGFYVTNISPVDGEVLLKEMEEYYKNNPLTDTVMKTRISGEMELIHAYINFNDVVKMHDTFQSAHKMLDGVSYIANKDKIVTFGSPHILYTYYKEAGKIDWILQWLEALTPYYIELSGGCGMGFLEQVWAEYHLERGECKEAQVYAYKAIYKAQKTKQISVIICSHFVLARIQAVKGNYAKALELLDDVYDEVEACNSPILSSAIDLCIGYIGGISEKKAIFADWLKFGNIDQSEVLYQGMGFNFIVYGKYLLLNEDYIQLEVLCEEMGQIFQRYSNQLGYLHAYILEAIAKYQLYGIEKARSICLKALEIGKKDGIILPIAEYGSYLMDILTELKPNLRLQKEDEFYNKIYLKSKEYSNYSKLLDETKISIPKLTKRELEIVELIVKGNTNREIAEQLYLAEVTVRKNITSIYRKLDVTGRASAVKKVLEYKIITY